MATGKLRAFWENPPFWAVCIAFGLGGSAIIAGLITLLSWNDRARDRIMKEKTAVLRQNHPELSALFAQWDSCYDRPVEAAIAEQVCDHKMIKDAQVIDHAPEVMAFLLERDAMVEALDGHPRSAP